MRFEKDITFVLGRNIIGNINNCIDKAYPNESCGFILGKIQEFNNKGDFKYRYNSEIFQCIESSISNPASFLIDNDTKILELSNITLKKKKA